MTLIVEDGTGKTDAETYQTVTAHKDYCDKRGITYSTDEAIEIALRKAFDFMLSEYCNRWKGCRANENQRGDWPRLNVEKKYPGTFWDDDEIPQDIREAQSELAIRAASSDLAPDISRAKSSVRVGPISVAYDPVKPVTTVFRAIETKLRPYFVGNGTLTQIVRT